MLRGAAVVTTLAWMAAQSIASGLRQTEVVDLKWPDRVQRQAAQYDKLLISHSLTPLEREIRRQQELLELQAAFGRSA